MANIIYDEKRFVNVGEVCAIELKNIKPASLTLNYDYGDDIVNFYTNGNVSSDNDITFIKYLGNGLFMDLVSDQLFITEIFNEDDFGTDELNLLNNENIEELTKMQEFWNSIQNPTNIEEFEKSISIFMSNPLCIDIEEAPFMSINSDVAQKFASQSLEQLKSKLLSSKLNAQQQIKQQFSELENKIIEHYHSFNNSTSPKKM